MRYLLITVLITLFIIHTTLSGNESEDERKLKRRKQPCKRSEYGRTFFDWSFLYADITHNYNYNHNYNINCGNNPIVPAPPPPLPPPLYDSFVPGGGHHRPHKWDCKKLHGCRGGIGSGNNRFGLGFLDLLFGGSKNKPEEMVDYEDQPVKPVSEDYDDVPPPESSFQNWKPGKYVGTYNPLVGGYVSSVDKLAKEVDRFFEPLYDYFQ